MAEYVTQRENSRRKITVIICILIDVVAIAGAVYAGKRATDLRESPNITENLQNVRKALADEEGRLSELERSFIEFSQPVGWRLEPDPDRPDLVATPLDFPALERHLDSWQKILAERYGATQYTPWSAGGGKPLHIPELIDELDRLTQERLKEAAAILGAVGAWDDGKKDWTGVKAEEARVLADQRKMEEAKGTTLRERLADVERLRAEESSLLQRTQDELKTKQDDKNTARQAYTAQVRQQYEEDAKARVDIAEFQDRVDAIVETREQAEELREADGRVVHMDPALQVAYLNIGTADGLFEGTRFEVFGVERGGRRVVRGEVRVIAVETLFSRAQILRLRAGESIRAGDFLYNGHYDGAQVKKFVLAGRFTGPYTKEELARKLREFGETYSETVTKDVNYCVIGEGHETDPVYLEANRIGVKVLREKTLLDYLGIKE